MRKNLFKITLILSILFGGLFATSKTLLDSFYVDGVLGILDGNSLSFFESKANGTDRVSFAVPSSLTGTTAFQLPDGDGTADQVIKTNGSGTLSWTDVAASGGSGSKNFVDAESSEFENGTGTWDTDDGGGSVANYLSIAQTSTAGEVLAGTNSLEVTKTANDASGEFVFFQSLTLDLADQGAPIFGSFQFRPGSAYVSNAVRVEVWDESGTPAQLYTGPDDILIPNKRDKIHFVAYPEDDTDVVELRLIMDSTTATAFDFTIDEVKMGPAAQVETIYRKSQTIDLTGSGDFTGGEIQVERVGNTVTLSVSGTTFSSSTNPQSATGIIPDWALPSETQVGAVYFTGPSTSIERVYAVNTGVVGLYFRNYSGADSLKTSQSIPATISYTSDDVAGPTLNENELPIQTIRVQGAGNSGGTLTANDTDITFTEVKDDHGLWNGTQFTAPKDMDAYISGSIDTSASTGSRISAYVDGTLERTLGRGHSAAGDIYFSGAVSLLKGEVLSFRSSGADTLVNTASRHWIEISSKPDYTVLGAVKNYELVESKSALANYTITADTFGDLTSIELTPGTWDINCHVLFLNNGAGAEAGVAQIGVSTTSGNSSSGLVLGDNSTEGEVLSTNGDYLTLSNPVYTVTPITNTTYYFKAFKEASITDLQVAYKIHARRIR